MKPKILIGKLFEYVVLAGVVTFLGLVFLYEILDLVVIEQIKRKFKKKKPRRTPRRVSK